eukprot:jgi/Tetstr1/421177/TSEL_012219.t1
MAPASPSSGLRRRRQLSPPAALLLLLLPALVEGVTRKKRKAPVFDPNAAVEQVHPDVTELNVGVTYMPEECEGYVTSGREFDSSYTQGKPIQFMLGSGRVIPGWEEGLLGMCVGEKRALRIPPHLAYGEEGRPPVIPPSATLIFDTELVAIKPAEEREAELRRQAEL